MTERIIDATFCGTSVVLIQRGLKTQTRRVVSNLRVRLAEMVTSDLVGIMPLRKAKAGVHKAKLNPHGAVSAMTPDGDLGLRPGEFQFVCPWIPKGQTVLGDFGKGKRGWMVVPSEPQRVRILETWRTHERPEDGVDGIMFAADDAFVRIEATSDAATRWVVAHNNGKHGDRWRSPRFMPRWASRCEIRVMHARLMHLKDITREDAIAEGVTFTDYGKYSPGWRFGPSTSSDECLGSPETAFGNGWNRLHAGDDWNLKDGPCPFDQNPWVWAYTFCA